MPCVIAGIGPDWSNCHTHNNNLLHQTTYFSVIIGLHRTYVIKREEKNKYYLQSYKNCRKKIMEKMSVCMCVDGLVILKVYIKTFLFTLNCKATAAIANNVTWSLPIMIPEDLLNYWDNPWYNHRSYIVLRPEDIVKLAENPITKVIFRANSRKIKKGASPLANCCFHSIGIV